MLPDFLHCLAHESLIPFVRALRLELYDQNGLRSLCGLSEVFVESRTLLAVCKKMRRKLGIAVLGYHQTFDVVVVIDYDFPVGGEMDVALAAPEAAVLSEGEACDTVLTVNGLLAFPIPSVGRNAHLSIVVHLGKFSCLSLGKTSCQRDESRANYY